MKKLIIILLCLVTLIFAVKAVRFFTARSAVSKLLDKTDSFVIRNDHLSYLAISNDYVNQAHPNGDLFYINKPEDIGFLKSSMKVAIIQQLYPSACRCRGEYKLVFMSKSKPIAEVGFAHASHLKNVPGFKGDLYLQPSAAIELKKWIDTNNPVDIDSVIKDSYEKTEIPNNRLQRDGDTAAPEA